MLGSESDWGSGNGFGCVGGIGSDEAIRSELEERIATEFEVFCVEEVRRLVEGSGG